MSAYDAAERLSLHQALGGARIVRRRRRSQCSFGDVSIKTVLLAQTYLAFIAFDLRQARALICAQVGVKSEPSRSLAGCQPQQVDVRTDAVGSL